MPISRREFTFALSSISLSTSSATADDSQLLDLCKQFGETGYIHDTTALNKDEAEKVYQALDALEHQIMQTQAMTLEGVVAKAFVAAWTRVGDLDPSNAVTAEGRLSISIVRDLVTLYAPKREWRSIF